VLVNGAYGERMAAIARRLNRPVAILSWPEDRPVAPAVVERTLDTDRGITHVALVHCETATGLLKSAGGDGRNRREKRQGLAGGRDEQLRRLADRLAAHPESALMASSDKCLEGVPGLGFALVELAAPAASREKSPSLSLDLHDQ